MKYNKSLTFNCSGIYICTPSETREILSADLLGTRSGTITSEDSTHKLYLVANSLQSGYNRSSIYICLRKDIYPSKDDILNPRPTAIFTFHTGLEIKFQTVVLGLLKTNWASPFCLLLAWAHDIEPCTLLGGSGGMPPPPPPPEHS